MLIMPTLESQTLVLDARPEQMRSPAQTCKLWTMFDDAANTRRRCTQPSAVVAPHLAHEEYK